MDAVRKPKASVQPVIVNGDNWSKIENDYEKACKMSCKPGNEFPKVKTGDVIDEEKSVRWNREEVARIQERYLKEVQRLNKEKNEAILKVEQRAVNLIAADADISIEKAQIVWNFVYARYHAYGEMFNVIYDYLDLAEQLAH